MLTLIRDVIFSFIVTLQQNIQINIYIYEGIVRRCAYSLKKMAEYESHLRHKYFLHIYVLLLL